MAGNINMYQGETFDFVLEGDENYNFGTSGTQPFRLFLYPDGTNTSVSANAGLIKKIDSRDTSSSITHGDGYVVREGDYKAHCILPYTATQDMKTGRYTIELMYGDSQRAVSIWNTAFALISSYSNEIA